MVGRWLSGRPRACLPYGSAAQAGHVRQALLGALGGAPFVPESGTRCASLAQPMDDACADWFIEADAVVQRWEQIRGGQSCSAPTRPTSRA
jgi:hypothetical protein